MRVNLVVHRLALRARPRDRASSVTFAGELKEIVSARRRNPRETRRTLPAGIVRFRLCSTRRLETENRFAFFHQIETIARNRFQIGRVSLEQIDLARLMCEQILLFVYLLLQIVDLRTALY